MASRKTLYWILAAGYLLIGCAGTTASRMGSSRIEPFLTILESWPNIYQDNFGKIKTFSGKANLTIESMQYNGNVGVTISYTSPDKMAVKEEGPLGIDIARIYLGQNRFIIYDQHNNFFTSGDIDDPYLNRFMQTNFTLKDIRASALGFAIGADLPATLEDDLHGLFLTPPDEIQYRYLVNPKTGLLETAEAVREGRVFMRQTFQNYRIVNEVYFPTVVQMTMLEQRERVTIYYESVDINGPVDQKLYDLEINSQVEQTNLD